MDCYFLGEDKWVGEHNLEMEEDNLEVVEDYCNKEVEDEYNSMETDYLQNCLRENLDHYMGDNF